MQFCWRMAKPASDEYCAAAGIQSAIVKTIVGRTDLIEPSEIIIASENSQPDSRRRPSTHRPSLLRPWLSFHRRVTAIRLGSSGGLQLYRRRDTGCKP